MRPAVNQPTTSQGQALYLPRCAVYPIGPASRGHPAYRYKDDSDNDIIVCE